MTMPKLTSLFLSKEDIATLWDAVALVNAQRPLDEVASADELRDYGDAMALITEVNLCRSDEVAVLDRGGELWIRPIYQDN
jgi:hypothetical protein